MTFENPIHNCHPETGMSLSSTDIQDLDSGSGITIRSRMTKGPARSRSLTAFEMINMSKMTNTFEITNDGFYSE